MPSHEPRISPRIRLRSRYRWSKSWQPCATWTCGTAAMAKLHREWCQACVLRTLAHLGASVPVCAQSSLGTYWLYSVVSSWSWEPPLCYGLSALRLALDAAASQCLRGHRNSGGEFLMLDVIF